ncbi:MAG TPA: caspase family protein, partial [Propionibacteriaceae bacterium]|nr:caspase family protein [Propionibacteriaceae bacterium]
MNRALLIGIDHYDRFNSLDGCVNDVDALEPLLSRNDDNSPNFDCQKRTSTTGGVTRDALIGDLDALLGGGADVALLYFAGHGSGSGTDVALVTQDATAGTLGIAFSEVLAKVAESSVREVVLILDCCFSGAAGGIPQLASSAATLRDGVSILAASRGDQPAPEADGRGVFCTFLGGALEGGAADVIGKVTIAGLYAYLDESFGAWDQRPAFKANVDHLHELRSCTPAVPLTELRQICDLFPARDALFSLDPSYEPDAEPRNSEHERVFSTLQKYRAAKLLQPVGADHMYFAAMESQACRLTPLGRH